MKNLLFLLPFLSITTQAQTAVKNQTASSTEIGFNLGYAPDNAMQNFSLDEYRGGLIRASISLLKNKGNIQYGVTIEGGTYSGDYWYISPAAVLNRRFSTGQAYFYAGAMAGYTCADAMMKASYFETKMAQGYVFGIQGGYVQPIGKHLSFTSEIAIRSTQLWQKYTEYEAYYPYPYTGYPYQQPEYHPYQKTMASTIVSFPVTIGLRYRL